MSLINRFKCQVMVNSGLQAGMSARFSFESCLATDRAMLARQPPRYFRVLEPFVTGKFAVWWRDNSTKVAT